MDATISNNCYSERGRGREKVRENGYEENERKRERGAGGKREG